MKRSRKPDARSHQRTATVIASGIGGFPAIADAVRSTDSKGIRRLSPFTVPSFLVNLAAGHISIRYGSEADAINAGFCAAARALSSGFNDMPEASRPFDCDRDGFVMGEGAGVVVIEALDHALARGATIAELIGYGTMSDAFHMTAGREDGDGAKRAMQIALQQAGISERDIQHLNAHATSTPVGDHGELEAIKTIFGTNGGVAVSSTKSATGHLLGAAGGLEAIFAILALRDQIAPETLNLDNPGPSSEGIDLVRGSARAMKIDHVLSNGFGFGGVNASVVLRKM
jgi:3-oxoacyl-[acyl-carrier-protein] synthase II